MSSDPVAVREAFQSFADGEATTQELLDNVEMDLEDLLLSLAHLRHRDHLELVNHKHGDFWRYEA